MSKLLEIFDCWQCTCIRGDVGEEFCAAMDGKPTILDPLKFPDWCPLPDAEEKEVADHDK